MKKNETQKITVKAKWQMLTSATDLVFALYNGMQGGGVENPMAILGNNRGQAAPDKLGALTRAGLIENDEGRWELSQNVFEFLESLAGTSDEANVKTILGNRDTLERNVSYYFTAKKEESDPSRYLALVRRNLKTILSNIKKTLTAIDYNIRDSYVGESSITLKTQILKENLDKLEELEKAVRGEPSVGVYDGILPLIDSAFGETDEQLHALKVWFQNELARFYTSKRSKIILQLRAYLDRIEKIDKPARKIAQIFRLWSNNQLIAFSDVLEVQNSLREPFQKTRELNLSLDKDLEGDDNKILNAAVRGLDIESGEARLAKGVRRSDINRKAPADAVYHLLADVRKVYKDYTESGGDRLLAEYVLSYSGYIREHAFRERIGIFLEVVNQFRPHLVTDNEYTLFEDDGVAYKCKNIKLRTNG